MSSIKDKAFELANLVGDLQTDHELACQVLTELAETLQKGEGTNTELLNRISIKVSWWLQRQDNVARRR